jgi:hypothetical protein
LVRAAASAAETTKTKKQRIFLNVFAGNAFYASKVDSYNKSRPGANFIKLFTTFHKKLEERLSLASFSSLV